MQHDDAQWALVDAWGAPPAHPQGHAGHEPLLSPAHALAAGGGGGCGAHATVRRTSSSGSWLHECAVALDLAGGPHHGGGGHHADPCALPELGAAAAGGGAHSMAPPHAPDHDSQQKHHAKQEEQQHQEQQQQHPLAVHDAHHSSQPGTPQSAVRSADASAAPGPPPPPPRAPAPSRLGPVGRASAGGGGNCGGGAGAASHSGLPQASPALSLGSSDLRGLISDLADHECSSPPPPQTGGLAAHHHRGPQVPRRRVSAIQAEDAATSSPDASATLPPPGAGPFVQQRGAAAAGGDCAGGEQLGEWSALLLGDCDAGGCQLGVAPAQAGAAAPHGAAGWHGPRDREPRCGGLAAHGEHHAVAQQHLPAPHHAQPHPLVHPGSCGSDASSGSAWAAAALGYAAAPSPGCHQHAPIHAGLAPHAGDCGLEGGDGLDYGWQPAGPEHAQHAQHAQHGQHLPLPQHAQHLGGYAAPAPAGLPGICESDAIAWGLAGPAAAPYGHQLSPGGHPAHMAAQAAGAGGHARLAAPAGGAPGRGAAGGVGVCAASLAAYCREAGAAAAGAGALPASPGGGGGADPVLTAGARTMAEQLVRLARTRPNLLLTMVGGALGPGALGAGAPPPGAQPPGGPPLAPAPAGGGCQLAPLDLAHDEAAGWDPAGFFDDPSPLPLPPPPTPHRAGIGAGNGAGVGAPPGAVPPYAVIQQLPPRPVRRRGPAPKRRRLEAAPPHLAHAARGGLPGSAPGGGPAVPMQVMSALLQLVATAVQAQREQDGGGSVGPSTGCHPLAPVPSPDGGLLGAPPGGGAAAAAMQLPLPCGPAQVPGAPLAEGLGRPC